MIRPDVIDPFRVYPGKKFRQKDCTPGGSSRTSSRGSARTSTEWAPWYVVPAGHKWVTRAAVADVVTTAIRGIDLRVPEPTDDDGKWPGAARAAPAAEE